MGRSGFVGGLVMCGSATWHSIYAMDRHKFSRVSSINIWQWPFYCSGGGLFNRSDVAPLMWMRLA